MNKTEQQPNNYECPECGLHYTDEQIVNECEIFCKEHNACSIEITKQSVEAKTESEKLSDIS